MLNLFLIAENTSYGSEKFFWRRQENVLKQSIRIVDLNEYDADVLLWTEEVYRGFAFEALLCTRSPIVTRYVR
ncbi:hypothetical protein [Candidatus Anaplasma sp. TIGMIC]|uniref:hypothetical protein n=1 Tax=Candidatus Anaplasma sp. TIGMIC TaxID=3020713 RepID=UPI00233075E2|nr:hypothetical protein [Candidatus Anaplasma sp. TIGMIC]MDB1135082.1 hypothetical protein [Candidatus Anaplasma sp. TIGMIC]